MTEQEQKAVRQLVLESTMLGFNEGISTAAAMVRASADNKAFRNLLRLNPAGALLSLAAAMEETSNKSPTENP